MNDILRYSKDICELEDMINTIKLEKNRLFNLVNDLANFLDNNKVRYQSFNTYIKLLEELVMFIKWCNSNKYSEDEVNLHVNNIALCMEEFLYELKGKYRYNFIFKIDDRLDFLDGFKDYNNMNNNYIGNKIFNIVICYEKDIEKYKSEEKYNYVISYEYISKHLFETFTEKYYLNYQSYFLKNSIDRSKKSDIESISVGLSYGMFGIDERVLKENCKNLCLSSQDLFYSYMISKDIIEDNLSVKKCYICLGYYSLYFDLSKSVNERSKIENVYYPITHEKHNYVECKSKDIFDLSFIEDCVLRCIIKSIDLQMHFYRIIYKCGNEVYFNEFNNRKSNILPDGVEFRNINLNTNIEYGKIRANQHNQLIKYYKTRKENIEILESFIKYLNSKSILTNIIILPCTKYYTNYIDENFQVDLYNVLDCIKKKGFKFKVLDLSYDSEFDDNDFIDYDHLSELGAIKATEKIYDMEFTKLY